VRAETRWTLAAFGVTTAVALTDALLGARLILIGLLIAGPMLAAVRLDGPRTGLVAAYAMGLAVALGPVDGIWGTADQLVLCLVVAVGGGFATAIAFSRTGRERRMAQITRVAEVAQRAILRPMVPSRAPAIFASNLPHTRAPPTPEPTLTKYERRSRPCCSLNLRTRPGRHGSSRRYVPSAGQIE
jgi:hypothetical protein